MYINLGIIGNPLGHTLSPSLHAHFLDMAGLNGGYVAFEVHNSGELPDLIDFLRKYKFTGLNVTVPYKIDIMSYCDILDTSAEDVGAVNTLHFHNNKIIGYNTDVFGFSKMLETAKISTINKKVLLLGAGGGARSVVTYLKNNKPKSLTIMNRTRKNADELALSSLLNIDTCDYKSFKNTDYDIIINSTSVGLKGGGFPSIGIIPGEAVIDLQYKPSITSFLANYSNLSKVKKVNGFSMLIWQAHRSFSIWTGIEPVPNIGKLTSIAYSGMEKDNV